MQTWPLLLLSTGLLTACAGDPAPAYPDAAPDASAAPQLAATATPTTIAAGESFTLAVEIDNFEVVNPTTSPGVEPGKGHWHYQLDTWANYVAAWTPAVTASTTGLTPGEHTVTVWLVDGNHVEITPPTETTLTITVE